MNDISAKGIVRVTLAGQVFDISREEAARLREQISLALGEPTGRPILPTPVYPNAPTYPNLPGQLVKQIVGDGPTYPRTVFVCGDRRREI